MYEIIWSWRSDKYIIRLVSVQSNITPKFVGTFAECTEQLKIITGA